MRKDDAVAKLKDFEPSLRALGARALFLFGSTARGEATPTSDIDLFLDLDPSAQFTLLDLVRAKHLLEDGLTCVVDMGTRRGLHPRLRQSIEAEAIQIF